jgi:hypothetical protein
MEDKFTSQDGGYKVLLLAGGAGGALMGMVFQFGPMVVRALRTAIPP